MKIAFLGTGLMGSAFATRLINNGHEVRVWNRTAAKAQALQKQGALVCADSKAAVSGADRIHVSLSDDAVIDSVLEPLVQDIANTCWIIDHSTTTPTKTRERIQRWSERKKVYLHAPVFMAPTGAKEGSGLMMISGPKELCERVLPDLEKMATKVVNLGEAPERAAAFKLFGNLMLIGMLGVVGDVVRLADSLGIRPEDAVGLFQIVNPGSVLPARANQVAAGPYSPPSFEIAMARKDLELMISEAKRNATELNLVPVIAKLFDAALARGEGSWDYSAALRLHRT